MLGNTPPASTAVAVSSPASAGALVPSTSSYFLPHLGVNFNLYGQARGFKQLVEAPGDPLLFRGFSNITADNGGGEGRGARGGARGAGGGGRRMVQAAECGRQRGAAECCSRAQGGRMRARQYRVRVLVEAYMCACLIVWPCACS